MKLFLLSLVLMSSSFAAWEEYNGDWKGNGKYINKGFSYLCEHYQVSLSVSENHLKIYNGHYICKGKKTIIDDRDYIIDGEVILDQNQDQVGEITDEKILIKDKDPAYEIFFKRYEENLFVIESRIDHIQEEIMIGILK